MIKNLLEPDENQIAENKTESAENATVEPQIDKEFESAFADIEKPEAETETDSAKVSPESFEPAEDELIVSEKNDAPVETTEVENFEMHNPHFFQSAELSDEEESEMKNLFADFSDDEINLDLPENETTKQTEPTQTVPENVEEISNEMANGEPIAETKNEIASEIANESPIEDVKTEKPSYENPGLFYQPPAEKESFAETARKSGLAYAAAITLVGAVVFMLVIGWFADLLFGSKPWGMVGGIVLGAAIGFFQFFRLTAQIFRNKD